MLLPAGYESSLALFATFRICRAVRLAKSGTRERDSSGLGMRYVVVVLPRRVKAGSDRGHASRPWSPPLL
jgi:hypothetical protein